MKILLATDGSEHSNEMVKKFASRPFAPDTMVHIITVYDGASYMTNISPMGVLVDYYEAADKQLRIDAEKICENAANVLREKNLEVTISTAAIDGSVKSVILEEADKFGADLIVVGSHGHGVVAGFLLGSVSQSVALNAKCSVEIVRN